MSGVAFSQYGINGGAWTTGNSLTVATPGVTTVSYGSIDNAGNIEAANSASVRIDTSIPTATLDAASVRQGRTARLRFRIDDASPSCGAANLTIAFTHNRTTLRTIPLSGVPIDTWLSSDFRCTLVPGRYRLSLSATDLAGNWAKAVCKLTAFTWRTFATTPNVCNTWGDKVP